MRRIAALLMICAAVVLVGCTQPKATSTAPRTTGTLSATTPAVPPAPAATTPAATKPAETKPAESKPGDKTTPPASPK